MWVARACSFCALDERARDGAGPARHFRKNATPRAAALPKDSRHAVRARSWGTGHQPVRCLPVRRQVRIRLRRRRVIRVE